MQRKVSRLSLFILFQITMQLLCLLTTKFREKQDTITQLYNLVLSFPVNTFQENLLKTLLQLEKTYFDMAATSKKDTLVISDRGAMDPSSCMNSFAITIV